MGVMDMVEKASGDASGEKKEGPQGSEKGWANLRPGLHEGLERGPDGRLLPRPVKEEDEVFIDVMAEMEAMLGRPKNKDRGNFQKALRGEYEKDLLGFLDRLEKLKAKRVEGKDAGEDAGSEAALQLAETLLRQWNGPVQAGAEGVKGERPLSEASVGGVPGQCAGSGGDAGGVQGGHPPMGKSLRMASGPEAEGGAGATGTIPDV